MFYVQTENSTYLQSKFVFARNILKLIIYWLVCMICSAKHVFTCPFHIYLRAENFEHEQKTDIENYSTDSPDEIFQTCHFGLNLSICYGKRKAEFVKNIQNQLLRNYKRSKAETL